MSDAIPTRALAFGVDSWIDGARVASTDRDLDEVAAAIASSGAGDGPAPPGLTEVRRG